MEQITHCISIKEPWASAIVAKLKTIEWRSRKLIARPPQTIAIATSKTGAGDYLPGGYIVGVARITAVVPWRDEQTFRDRAVIGTGLDYGYAMMIGGFAACKPVPVRGNVGIYRVPEGFAPVYAESREELAEWWNAARVWQDGPKNTSEQIRAERMQQYGLGWRMDD